jgi:hypothetical protein
MKFTANRPYATRETYRNREWVTVAMRPNISHDETVVSETQPNDKGRGGVVVVSYDVKVEKSAYSGKMEVKNLSLLARDAAEVITAENVDAVWELVKTEYAIDAVPNKYYFDVIPAVLRAKGWYDYSSNFVMEFNCEAWGYMGGTGCGQLIHKLLFDKIIAVRPELTGVRKHVVTLWFSYMLGAVKATRAEHAHLRDTVAEDELFVTLNAHPICQNSVRYVGASGYPVKAATEATCSCSKCAAKLGITCASAKAIKAVAKTPDSIDYNGFKLTYAETTKAGPKSQRTGKSQLVNCTGVRIEALDGSAMPAIKAVNAMVKERGQGGRYDRADRVDGIYYVEALKAVSGVEEGKAVFVKTGERTKDASMAVAKLLVDSNFFKKGA